MEMTFLFLGNLGFGEWALVFGAILLLFGGKKIPELMRGIGQGVREFNKARTSVENELREGMKEKDSHTEKK